MTTPVVPVATHAYRQCYLYAFATQGGVLHHVRTQAVQEDAARLPEILACWAGLQARVAELTQREAELADGIRICAMPPEAEERLAALGADPLFQRTFGQFPIRFQLVELDKLIAPQRVVNLDYVERLLTRLPLQPTMEDLLALCLSPAREVDPIQHLEIAPNTHVFSSPNADIRFLGAFFKPLTPEDLAHAAIGGVPAAAIVAFVGYGGNPVNVLEAGQRLILNNGFHRVYALRSLGITEIPVVVQHVTNPQLELPREVLGLPRDYLVHAPRPVLIKDFFEPDFAVTLRVRERIKMVTVSVGLSQHEVPS